MPKIDWKKSKCERGTHIDELIWGIKSNRAVGNVLLLPPGNENSPPKGWIKPSYNTPEYWAAVSEGWISEEDIRSAHLKSMRAKATIHKRTQDPRARNDAPKQSNQYANAMSTQAARDNRLTPMAKALLQIIRARVGNGKITETTKETLGAIIGRSKRSIQRYLKQLREYGYIETDVRKNRAGWHTGLILFVTTKTLPFWKNDNKLAEWIENGGWAKFMGVDHTKNEKNKFSGETELSSNNYTPNLLFITQVQRQHLNRISRK